MLLTCSQGWHYSKKSDKSLTMEWGGKNTAKVTGSQRNIINHVPSQNQTCPCSKHANLPECDLYLCGPAFVGDTFAAFIPGLRISIRLITKQADGERDLPKIIATGEKSPHSGGSWFGRLGRTHTYQHIRKDRSLIGDDPQPASSCPWCATHQAGQTMLHSSNTSQTCFKNHFSSASFLLMLIAWKLFFDLCYRFVSASQNSDSETTDVPES